MLNQCFANALETILLTENLFHNNTDRCLLYLFCSWLLLLHQTYQYLHLSELINHLTFLNAFLIL